MVVATMVTASLCWQQDARAQCGSTNIALNKSVTTSGNGGGTTGAGITDGLLTNAYTLWQPNATAPRWAYIDLGSEKAICKVVIKWGYYNFSSTFSIQTTNTPAVESSWQTVFTENNNNPTDCFAPGVNDPNVDPNNYYSTYRFNTISIGAPNNVGRYIRLYVNNATGSWFVNEMEVYESTTTNSPPSVSLANPTNNITIAANTPLQLKANATDPDGTITEVGFYNGTTLLNDPPQTVAPWEYTWTPVTAGTYTITAKAKDNNGAISTSLSVTVTVTPPNAGWGLLGNSVSSNASAFIGTIDPQPFIIKTNDIERYRVTTNGQMLIGSTQLAPSSPANTLLTVNGYIMAKGLKITQLSTNWPDYVFEKSYRLMSLPALAEFIKKNKHLPSVPSAKTIQQEGVSIGEMQAILLRKIEELTLYLIEQNKIIEQQNKKMEQQEQKIKQLGKKLPGR
jgi:hypothetical protein